MKYPRAEQPRVEPPTPPCWREPRAHRTSARAPPAGRRPRSEGRLLSPIAYSDPIRQHAVRIAIGIFEPWYRRIDNVTFLSRSNRTKMRSRKSSPRTSHDAPTPQHMHHANTSSILNVTASSETAVPRPRSLHSGLSAASALTLLPYRLRLYVPNRIVRLQLQDGSRPRPLPACWSPPLATPWADELRSAGRSPDGPAVGTGRRRARTAMQARPRRASRA